MFAQSRFVNFLAIGGVILPAAEDDPLPFVGQRPDGGVVRTTLGTLLEVVGGRPAAAQNTLPGILVETLFVELGTEIAPVNVTAAATTLGDGGNPRVVLQLGRGREAFTLGTQAGQQSRSQHRP